jgi:hypothetical protein
VRCRISCGVSRCTIGHHGKRSVRALRGEAVNARRPRERAGEAPAQRIDGVEHSATIIRVMAGMCPERTNNLIAQLTALQERLKRDTVTGPRRPQWTRRSRT